MRQRTECAFGFGRWGKIITTPCRILAEKGNPLELPRTRFVNFGRTFFPELGETLEPAPEAARFHRDFYRVVSAGTQSERTGSNRSVSAERGKCRKRRKRQLDRDDVLELPVWEIRTQSQENEVEGGYGRDRAQSAAPWNFSIAVRAAIWEMEYDE